jgi:xanthine dehydrogenase accessory factor
VPNVFSELSRLLMAGSEAVLTTIVTPAGTERRLAAGEGAPAAPWPEAGSLVTERTQERTVIVERFAPRPRLVVFGGGHIALALVPMAATMDFLTTVYDDRPSFSSPARFPAAQAAICESFGAIGQNLALGPGDFVVITTRGHRHDEDCLRFVLGGPEPLYVGMIGSRRRVATVRDRLSAVGFPEARLARLCSPIGLPIGAVTPPEIAVSILAQIVQKRREAEKAAGRGHLETFPDQALLRRLASGDREGLALVTVVAAKGSTPRRAGAKMAVFFDGRSLGSIGGGCAEAGVIARARPAIGTGGHLLYRVDLSGSAEEDGMVCGGWMEVLVEDWPGTARHFFERSR